MRTFPDFIAHFSLFIQYLHTLLQALIIHIFHQEAAVGKLISHAIQLNSLLINNLFRF